MDQSYLAVDIFLEKMEIQRVKYIHKIHIFPLLFFHFRFKVTTFTFSKQHVDFFFSSTFLTRVLFLILSWILKNQTAESMRFLLIVCLHTGCFMTTIKINNDGVKGGGMSPLGELKGRPPPWKLGWGGGGETPWKNWGLNETGEKRQLLVSVFDF